MILAVLASTARSEDPSPARVSARITTVAAPGLAMPPAIALVAAEANDLNQRVQPVIVAELQRVGILVDDHAPARLEFRTRVRQLPTWSPPFTITSADPLHRRNNRPMVEVPMPEFGPSSPDSGPTYALMFTLAEAGRPVLWRAVGEASVSGLSPQQVIGALVPLLVTRYGTSVTEQRPIFP